MIEPTWESDCGRVRLWHGDCLQILPTIDAATVNAVIIDPPYGIDYQSARRIDRSEWLPKIANDTSPFVAWLPDARRLCVDPACCLCFCRWDVQEAFRVAMVDAGFDVAAQVIWDRESHGMGDLNGCPAPQHDVIWFGRVGAFKFPGDRPKSVIRSLRISGGDLTHPNEKPLDLMRRMVTAYCPEGGVVCDPTMGSGSTGEACVLTGRRFIGIECDGERFENAKRRIQAAIGMEVKGKDGRVQKRMFGVAENGEGG